MAPRWSAPAGMRRLQRLTVRVQPTTLATPSRCVAHVVDANVAFAPFHTPDIGRVHPGDLREFFLREPLGTPFVANARREFLARGHRTGNLLFTR